MKAKLKTMWSYVLLLMDAIVFWNKSITGAEALDYLESIHPDNGESCWTERTTESVQSKETVDLSVIFPAYNVEKWVQTAIESVLTQETEYNFELIIVEDGSTDNTEKIVDMYQGIENVRIIHQKNQGLSGARNTALAMARGEYLMFVDSDDVILPGCIQNLMECAVKNGADVVAGNYEQKHRDGRNDKGSHFTYGEVQPLGVLYGQPWGKVYNRTLFQNLQFPERYWFEDSIFAQIVWPSCRKAYTIPQNVYRYFINDAGISLSSRKKVKSIDSLYVTKRCLKDKERFGLLLSDKDYTYFLRMVLLTFSRTKWLGPKIARCIFAQQCEIKRQYFMHFQAEKQYAALESAIINENYVKYMMCCVFGTR